MKSILVIFSKDLPKKNKKWFEQFDEIIGPKELEKFISPGSVQRAYELVNSVSRLNLPKVEYKGYELWWMNYENIFNDFCLPYTQYQKLLEHLKDFEKIYLFQPPWPGLFRYFLKAHNCRYFILNTFKFRSLLPFSLGASIQVFLSFLFLPWLIFSRPKLMVWASDKFDPPSTYDFRMKFIYEELKIKKTLFIEFIRSMESWPVVLQHAFKRKRPVFYSAAIIELIYSLANLFNLFKKRKKHSNDFWFLVGAHYLCNIRGTIWSINAIRFILKWVGVRAAIIPAACSRTFHETLACKLSGIKTVGIQHAVIPKYAFVSDFMPEFDGLKKLSVDRYGIWSEQWREYYLSHSRAYLPEQLYVSGPMRPLTSGFDERLGEGEKLKVLFISEQLADPKEIMPYVAMLLKQTDFELYFKFRPYRDGFELWLKDNEPDVYKKILEQTKILRGAMEEAISQCDVVVGSHSTAVLESLLQLKPFVFFWTDKWGDYFDIKSLAKNPQELVDRINESIKTSKETLKQLQERFFGNPYQNGSKWVVEQALEFVENYGK